MTDTQKQVIEETTKIINENLSKYNGVLKDKLSNEDADLVAQIIAEAFMLGANYGLDKARELA